MSVVTSIWDPLTAIGTLAVAFATLVLASITVFLVRATLKVARQSEADVRAQWTPVLLVRDRVPEDMGFYGIGIIYEGSRLVVWVENVGRGPALGVSAWLEDVPGRPAGSSLAAGALSGSRAHPTLAPGDLCAFEWVELRQPRQSGRLSYGDMSGVVSGSTEFVLHYGDDRVETVWQTVKIEPALGLAWWQRIFPAALVAPFTQRRLRNLGVLPTFDDE